MHAKLFGALQNHLISGRIIWCNASLFGGVAVSYSLQCFRTFSRRERSRERDHSRSREKHRRKSRSRDRHEDYYRERSRRETVTVRETARETASVSGSIAVSWRGRCVSCLSLSLFVSSLSSGFRCTCRGQDHRYVCPWTYNVMSCLFSYS